MKRINWRGYFTRNKKKSKSPLDLNELFPGYFNKWVFRSVIIIMLIFTVFVYASNDGLKFEYIYCPEDAETFCKYYPKHNISDDGNVVGVSGVTGIINTSYNFSRSSNQEFIILQPGEHMGKIPNFWARHYNSLCLRFVLMGFLINHLFK